LRCVANLPTSALKKAHSTGQDITVRTNPRHLSFTTVACTTSSGTAWDSAPRTTLCAEVAIPSLPTKPSAWVMRRTRLCSPKRMRCRSSLVFRSVLKTSFKHSFCIRKRGIALTRWRFSLKARSMRFVVRTACGAGGRLKQEAGPKPVVHPSVRRGLTGTARSRSPVGAQYHLLGRPASDLARVGHGGPALLPCRGRCCLVGHGMEREVQRLLLRDPSPGLASIH